MPWTDNRGRGKELDCDVARHKGEGGCSGERHEVLHQRGSALVESLTASPKLPAAAAAEEIKHWDWSECGIGCWSVMIPGDGDRVCAGRKVRVREVAVVP